MSEENRSNEQVHQEGIDHIKSNMDGGSGTESRDAGGIEKGAGGVSSSAYVDSPVPTEPKSVVQSTVDTVKGYLGVLNLGGGSKEGEGEAKEIPADTSTSEARNAGEDTNSTAATGGVVASTTAAASAATAAVVGSEQDTQTGGVSSTTNDQTFVNPFSSTSSASATKDQTMADAAPQKDTELGHRDADVPGDENALSDAPGENASHAKKDNWPKENKSAIPTAGGERLGEKHWGESQVVPDVPDKRNSEAGNVSSREGQPDSQTRDNTAQNTGSAAPASSSAANPSEGDGEGKQKFTDKIKDKLNIGK